MDTLTIHVSRTDIEAAECGYALSPAEAALRRQLHPRAQIGTSWVLVDGQQAGSLDSEALRQEDWWDDRHEDDAEEWEPEPYRFTLYLRPEWAESAQADGGRVAA